MCTTKICGKCKQDLPITEYHKRNQRHLQSYCKQCKLNSLPKDRSSKWRTKHPALHNAQQAKRRAAKLHATPQWADFEAIKDVYMEAEYFQMHVDHIIPLQGKDVCGLHVWENLQLLSEIENLKKGNRLHV